MKQLQRDLIQEGKRLQAEKWGEIVKDATVDRRDVKAFWAALNRFRGGQASYSDQLIDRNGSRPVLITDKTDKERLMR